jgi:hypothetical protein
VQTLPLAACALSGRADAWQVAAQGLKMEERTFRLSDIFIETVFERFSRTLKHLRSGAESEPYHQFIARVVEPYNRVTIDDLGAFIEAAFWASMTTE